MAGCIDVLLCSLFVLSIVVAELAPECKTSCTTESDGRTKKCTTSCTGVMPGSTSRSTGLLDKACVEECNGGPVHNLEELKPECEQKCPFKQKMNLFGLPRTEKDAIKLLQEKGVLPMQRTCQNNHETKLYIGSEIKWGCMKSPQQIASKKTEFSTLDDCLKYCQEKGLGKSAQECQNQCKEVPAGMIRKKQD